MKKLIIITFTLIMCLSLCSCGDSSQTIADTLVIERDGIKCINRNRFNECLELVKLNPENWNNYIDVIKYTEKIVEKDEFGEVISSEEIVRRVLGANIEHYYCYEDVVIELKNKTTGETIIYSLDPKGDKIYDYLPSNFNIKDYECSRIKGNVYVVNLPNEVIYSPLPGEIAEIYESGFYIAAENSMTPYLVNANIKEIICGFGSSTWEAEYMH